MSAGHQPNSNVARAGDDISQRKTAFLRAHPEYGYEGRIDGIHEKELAERLKDCVYLDHGGSGLYTSSHLSSSHSFLSRSVLLNPHSDPSTSILVDSVRESVLAHLGASSKTHSLVFTYNTSAALNLLASVFPFRARSELALTLDNHNSALGMREKMREQGPGARFSVVTPRDQVSDQEERPMKCCCSEALLQQNKAAGAESAEPPPAASLSSVNPCLFAFPAESNFDGRIYDLSLASTAKSYNFPLNSAPSAAATASSSASTAATSSHAAAAATCASNPLGFHHVGPQFRWYTLLDASKFLCTSPLDLSSADGSTVDFLTLSFYKMWGFPTGLAALVVKNATAEELWGIEATRNPLRDLSASASPSLSSLRRYFSGGTVNAVVADEDFHVVKSSGKLHELLEDGTIAFTTIVSVPFGIQLFKSLGPASIRAHCAALCEELFQWLRQQQYPSTGGPLCRFYGARGTEASRAHAIQFGPTLNFNFLDQHGNVIGYKTVEKCAIANRIHIRSGSFCNPGACQQSFPLSSAQIRSNLQPGYACWEDGENLGGVVNGSLRLSLGWCTRWEDVEAWKRFVRTEVVAMGTQEFVSTHQPSANGATEQQVASSVETPAATLEPKTSLFNFQLPAHFLQATPVEQSAAKPVATPAPAISSTVAPSSAAPLPTRSFKLPPSSYVLSSLTVYPLKSCGGMHVSSWLLSSSASGCTLFLDREFLLLDAYGVALSQKSMPQLQLIKPSVDIQQRQFTLHAADMSPLVIDLQEPDPETALEGDSRVASLCSLQVCGVSALGYVYDAPQHAHITEWLTSVVGKYTCLARKSAKLEWPPINDDAQLPVSSASTATLSPSSTSSSCLPSPSPTPASNGPSSSPATRSSFANEDDFLLVNAASVRDIEKRLHEYVQGHSILKPQANDAHISPHRFRPNFVIDSSRSVLLPFAEDGWRHVRIGPYRLRMKGGCARCIMVNVTPETGERQSSLYAMLNNCRKKDGRVLFGALLSDLTNEDEKEHGDSEDETATRWWPISVGMPCEAQ